MIIEKPLTLESLVTPLNMALLLSSDMSFCISFIMPLLIFFKDNSLKLFNCEVIKATYVNNIMFSDFVNTFAVGA